MIITAEWRTIKNLEDYQVSDDGRVRSLKNGKEQILKPGNNGVGHLYVNLYKDSKLSKRYIHRLMAEAFIPNPENKPMVRHLNDNPKDNRLENIAWGTSKENVNDAIENGTSNILKTRIPVILIKDGKSNFYPSETSAAEAIGTTQGSISTVIHNKKGNLLGYEVKRAKPRHIGKPKNK